MNRTAIWHESILMYGLPCMIYHIWFTMYDLPCMTYWMSCDMCAFNLYLFLTFESIWLYNDIINDIIIIRIYDNNTCCMEVLLMKIFDLFFKLNQTKTNCWQGGNCSAFATRFCRCDHFLHSPRFSSVAPFLLRCMKRRKELRSISGLPVNGRKQNKIHQFIFIIHISKH